MAYIKMTKENMDTSVVYVQAHTILKSIGVSRQTLINYIHDDLIDVYRWKNKNYLRPEDAKRLQDMHKAGII